MRAVARGGSRSTVDVLAGGEADEAILAVVAFFALGLTAWVAWNGLREFLAGCPWLGDDEGDDEGDV